MRLAEQGPVLHRVLLLEQCLAWHLDQRSAPLSECCQVQVSEPWAGLSTGLTSLVLVRLPGLTQRRTLTFQWILSKVPSDNSGCEREAVKRPE